MTTLLATHEHWGHAGGGWFFLFPLAWILVLFLIFGVLRRTLWRRDHHRFQSASGRSLLAERYARGEIDEQDYRQRLAVLDSIKS
jgi:putative membrane protein